MATKTILELEVQSNLAEQANLSKQIKENLQNAGASRVAAPVMAARQGARATDTNLSRGVGGVTGAEGRDFAKQAQGLGGLVHVYATFAANLFAASAAFSALSKAADTTNMIKGLDQLGANSGKSLGSLAKQLATTADGAISLRDAMTATAQSSAAGMTSDAILRMGNIAKQASQALGISMPDAISRLSRGITKLEPELLDEIGILIKVDSANQAYARSIGKSASALTDFEKRQGFANAVLEQGEKKFGAIKIDANPYAKILASMQNLAQSGLELINKIFGPIMNILSNSPLGLATVLALIAKTLLSQAIPALGQWKQSLDASAAAARETVIATNAARSARRKHVDSIVAEKVATDDLTATSKANLALEDLRAKAAAGKISKGTQRLIPVSASAVDKENLQILEAQTKAFEKQQVVIEKRLLTLKDPSAIARNKAELQDIKDATTLLQIKLQTGKDYEKLESERASKFERFTKRAADERRADAAAAVSQRKNILLTTSKEYDKGGSSEAWATLNKNIANARKGLDETGEKFKNNQKAMSTWNAGLTRVGGTAIIASGAINSIASGLGTIGIAVSITTVAFGILDSIFSTNAKTLDKYAKSLDILESAVDTIFSTLAAISDKDPLAVFSVETIQARANALQGLSDGLSTLVKDFVKVRESSSGWDKTIDALWDAIGRGSADVLSTNISKSISAALAGIEEGPLRAEALGRLQAVLGTKVDLTNIKATTEELRKLDNVDIARTGANISAVLTDISRKANNSASNLTGVYNSLTELGKLVQTQNATLMPTDTAGKLGTQMISSASELSKALSDPINSLLVLKKIVEDVNVLSVLSPDVANSLITNKTKIQDLSESYGALQKQVVASQLAMQKLKDMGKATERVDTAVGVANVETSQAKEIRSTLDSLEAAKNATQAEMKALAADLSSKVAKDFVDVGLRNLASSLAKAMSEGAIVAARGYLSVLKEAGMQTADAEMKLKLKDLAAQDLVIETTYKQIRAQQQNTNITEINNVLLKQLANSLALAEAGTSEVRREKALKEGAGLPEELALAIEKSKITNLSPMEASKIKGGGEFSDKALSDLAGYMSGLTGYLSAKAKIGGETEAAKVTGAVSVRKEDTQATQKVLAGLSEANTLRISELAIMQSVSAEYDTTLQKEQNILEISNLANAALSQRLSLADNLYALELARGKIGVVEKDRIKAIELTQKAIIDANKKETQDLATIKLRQLTDEQKGLETIRVKQANQATLELTETTAIGQAKLSQRQEEIQFLTSIGAITAEEATRKSATIALEQQSLQYNKDLAAIEADKAAKNQVFVDLLAQQFLITGAYNAKTLADQQLLLDSYTRQKSALDLINTTKQTSITLTAQQKALQDSQTEQMNLMVAATTNLATIFGTLGDNIGRAGQSLLKMAQDDTNYLSARAALEKTIGDPNTEANARQDALEGMKKLDKDRTKSEISNLANVAGASKKLFGEKTLAYKTLAKVEKAASVMSLALQMKDLATSLGILTTKVTAEGVAETSILGIKVASAPAKVAADAPGILSSFANLGPVGYAIGAALVASLLAMVGGGRGGTQVDMTGLTSADRQETQGTGLAYVGGVKTATGGGVFGDEAAKSTSIVDSLKIMKENSIEGLNYDNKMLKALEKLADSVVGAAKSLYSVPGLRAGTGFGTMEGTTSSGGFGSDIPLVGNLLSSIFGGGTSSSSRITSAGIEFKGTFADITNDVAGSITQYKDVLTQFHEDGGWFGSDSDWSTLNRETQALRAEVQKSLSDIFKDAENLFIQIGTKTNQSAESIKNILKTINVSMPVDIMGLTGQALIDELNAVIGTKLSDAASSLFSGFDRFKNFGEDYLATVLRVVDANNKVDQALRSIGSSFEIINNFNISEALVKAAGSLGTFMEQAAFFTDNFLSTSEKLVPIQASVAAELTRLNINSNITKDTFKRLILAQDLSTVAGQELYQSLMDLAPGFLIVTNAIEANVIEAAALELKIYELLGNTSKVLILSREKELIAMDASLRPRQKYINALTDEIALKTKLKTAYDASNNSLTNSIKTLTDYKTALTAGAASTLTPAEKYAQAKALLLQTAAQAQASITAESSAADIATRDTAISKLTSVSDTFLATSKELYASGSQYSQDFGIITTILESTTGILSAQKTDVEKQLTFLESITTATETTAVLLEKYFRAQVTTVLAREAAATSGSEAAISIPGHAMGGLAKGVALVGEKGPEIVDFQNPGRVYSNTASNDLFNTKELVAEIKALRNEVSKLRDEQQIQTGHLITSTYDASAKNADAIATVTQDAVAAENWKIRSQVKIA